MIWTDLEIALKICCWAVAAIAVVGVLWIAVHE